MPDTTTQRLRTTLADLPSHAGTHLGDRVAFLGVNSLAHLECWLGVPACGRVLADLNTRLAEDELAFMVGDCAPRVLIHNRASAGVARALRDRCPSLRTLICDGGAQGRDAQPRHVGAVPGDDQVPRRRDRNVVAATWVGARQVVLPRFEAAAVTAAIERERVTLATFVPTMLAMWLTHLEERARAGSPADISSLRNLHYAASPISPELQRRVCETLDYEIAQMYWMTEAAPTVTPSRRRSTVAAWPARSRSPRGWPRWGRRSPACAPRSATSGGGRWRPARSARSG